MSEDVKKVAETSAATAVAEPEFDPADQHTWSEDQRAKWNETGEQPVLPPKKQESEPAAPTAKESKSEVTKTETEADAETAAKQGKKERKPGEKLSAGEEISKLRAELRDVRSKLEERERSRVPETKPAAEKTETAEVPKRPNPFTWKGTPEEYEAAMEKWEAHQKSIAVQEFQRSEAAKAQRGELKKQFDEVKAKYPDAEAKIQSTYETFSKVQFPGVIRAMFDDSECLPDLMYVLSDETTRSNFIETVKTNPGKAIRALAQMEADIRSQMSKSEDKSETKSSAETKPRAPKPPSEVGGRGAAPEDVLRTAASSGDFRTFDAEMSSRYFAKK